MLGEAIHTARIAAGLTQAQLSEQTGITQAALSRYENDLRVPDQATLEQLASAVGVNTRLLTSVSQVAGTMAVDAHMRRRASAPARAWRKLEGRLNLLREHMHMLLSIIDYDVPHDIPKLDPLDYRPDTAARLLRAQWRMPLGPVRNLIAWMESAGCLVVEFDFGTPRVDGLSQWVDDHPLVVVNSRAPTDRKRLTLAHELGHIVMHSEPIHLSPEVETEAMTFAAEFLMPAVVIRPDLHDRSLRHLTRLKRKWMVSIAALIERAHDLGAISQTNRRSLYKALSARGWRTREPLSDQLPPETPSVPASIVHAYRELGYGPQEIADFGGFSDVARASEFLPLSRGFRIVDGN